jgi:very-short-patch-repair endonuclease
MGTAFIGREAVDAGHLTPYQLRRDCAVVFPGVYVAGDAELTARVKAEAAYLWSRRRGIVAGRSAAAVHGSKWVDARAPAALLYDNRHRPNGLHTWADRIGDDEVVVVDGMRVTSPSRTALDLACRYPLDRAVPAIDALARATHVKVADIELLAARYGGRHGIRTARAALDVVDPGAESPRETWLRLLIVRAGCPRPQTQIPVYDEYGQLVARVDMGWEHLKIAVEYDGDHHWTDRRQMTRDIRRTEQLNELGWIVIRVTAGDTPGTILRRIELALARRS